jgi:hypothetical protein
MWQTLWEWGLVIASVMLLVHLTLETVKIILDAFH